MKSLLVKDTTREEREEIVRKALTCGDGCDNCDGCALGAGDPMLMYQPYIDGKMELREFTDEDRAAQYAIDNPPEK